MRSVRASLTPVLPNGTLRIPAMGVATPWFPGSAIPPHIRKQEAWKNETPGRRVHSDDWHGIPRVPEIQNPLSATRVDRRSNPQGKVFSSSDGHCNPRAPSSAPLTWELKPENYATERRRGKRGEVGAFRIKSTISKKLMYVLRALRESIRSVGRVYNRIPSG